VRLCQVKSGCVRLGLVYSFFVTLYQGRSRFSCHLRICQVSRGLIKLDPFCSGEFRLGQIMSGYIRSGQVMSGYFSL
jgi:hypothetical protein